MKKKIALLGANGQLGSQIYQIFRPFFSIKPFLRDLINLEKIALETDFSSLKNFELIINAAAYTNVDKSEDEQDLAKQVNFLAVSKLAKFCQSQKIPIIHFSTDYVYGLTGNEAWVETATCQPVNYYAQTKLEGENALLEILESLAIFRVSWLYDYRSVNFVQKILKVFLNYEEAKIVDDQVGVPTWSQTLACSLLQILIQCKDGNYWDFFKKNRGVYNLCPAGQASWYEFSKIIFEQTKNHFNFKCKNIIPIRSEDFPFKAARPHWSVLSTKKVSNQFNLELPHWKNEFQIFSEQLIAYKKYLEYLDHK